ncbi:TonB family protein [Novosphingobium gossypii]|uniref:TonB family protein n=1 Tax=Novosphingobium gossypii TaxID=1604774 RepID=UPI003D25BD77
MPLLADGDPTSGVERAYEFDIPAQSLESALNQLSRASSVSILNDSATVARKRSLAIKGRMTVQEAVLRLLKGTGLRARFTAGGAIAITPGAKAEIALDRIEAVDRPTIRSLKQEPAWIAYAEKVQARIRTGLSADRELARGRYDVRIKVWLTRDGKAMRVELARSSGERERDARLLRLADGMTMDDPPPPNLRLPMTLEFRVR